MAQIRHLYPGGNTCHGFYSFYDYMVSPQAARKIVLKGGPGVGKSTFMKKLGEDFAAAGFDIEYHWCSSDNESLDGVVIGHQQFCVLDGTSPHIVDPRFPGAVDEIINLGEFWNRTAIAKHRSEIINLSNNIARCFERAYCRLREAAMAYQEWQSYYEEARDMAAVNRNILALAQDFLPASAAPGNCRHLFAGAITPRGLVTRVESIIDSDYALYGIKGNPGSGSKTLFDHTLGILNLSSYYAEIYHNPFEPNEIDIIVLPDSKLVLLNISSPFNYMERLPSIKFKRLLDFDQFSSLSVLDLNNRLLDHARSRFNSGIDGAVSFINIAKQYHDELESYYVPAMDFESIRLARQEIFEELMQIMSNNLSKGVNIK
ncbi:MAG: PRK06851 family protein [Syntrophomonadaceae bacterium]|nr:PRK06851 family protein [Syntrophomonadaceae bacterium]